MSRFFDFLTGGNTKVSANALADLHYAVDGCNPPKKKRHLEVEISRKLIQGEFL
jgi:hypothetical protein